MGENISNNDIDLDDAVMQRDYEWSFFLTKIDGKLYLESSIDHALTDENGIFIGYNSGEIIDYSETPYSTHLWGQNQYGQFTISNLLLVEDDIRRVEKEHPDISWGEPRVSREIREQMNANLRRVSEELLEQMNANLRAREIANAERKLEKPRLKVTKAVKEKSNELLKFRNNYYSKVVYLTMFNEISRHIDLKGYMHISGMDALHLIWTIEDMEGDRVIWKHGVTVSDMFEFDDFCEVVYDRLVRIQATVTNTVQSNKKWVRANYNKMKAEFYNKTEIQNVVPSNKDESVHSGSEEIANLVANELQPRQLPRMRSKSASRVSNRPKISEESILRSLGEVPRKSRTRSRSKSIGGTRRKRRASRKFSS